MSHHHKDEHELQAPYYPRMPGYLSKTCSVSSSRSAHLAIEILEVPLKHDQATAVSYTWGEFNRTIVTIGPLK